MNGAVDAVHFERVSDLQEWQRQASAAIYGLRMSAVGATSFAASFRTRRIGDLSFVLTRTAPHRAERDAELGPAGDARFGVSLQLEGTSVLTQGGRTRTLERGDFCTFDSTRPYTRTFEEPSRTFIVLFPRVLLHLPDRLLRHASAIVATPDGPLSSLSTELLGGMATRLDAFDDVVGSRVARAFVELLSAALVDQLGEGLAPDGSADRLRLAVLDHIADHIADRELSAGTIAAHFSVSTRFLFQLFSDQSRSLAQVIRDERMSMAEGKLADPGLRWAPISQIAEICGYVNANYFSRVFRARHGCTPSAYRQVRTGAAPAGGGARGLPG